MLKQLFFSYGSRISSAKTRQRQIHLQNNERMPSSSDSDLAHVALLPSAGMGHLTPFLRLAASLTLQNVQVTFIIPHPTVSLSETQALSQLFASFPQIKHQQFHLLPLDNPSDDPFFEHFQLIKNSSHLLSPLLSALNPPLSVFITDMSLASTVIPITEAISLPNYVLFTSSAKMLTFFLCYPTLADSKAMDELDEMDVVKIRGLELMPKSWIPPPLLKKGNNILKNSFIEDSRKVAESSGILVNTFESFEQESLRKLNDSQLPLERLPSVVAIGPLPPCDFEKSQSQLTWLDDQPAGSIMYVSFGSRTALSREQVRELGEGLVRSGSRFVWVVKDKKVDREDNEGLEEVIGDELMERMKEKGLVVRNWVNQEDVLRHPAVGGFFSHCGWNSVMEAAWHGVKILAWPQHGDQKVNADIVERIGLGTWVKSWGWGGEMIVNRAEIAEKIGEIMGNESLSVQALGIKEEARKTVGVGGFSNKGLSELINMWRKF
ncbi:PREDICTED: UDP-glycosyltransferase 88A1-like [Populus euphratica]|uniref:UDP-glycosyltransferase 88A1-like n=1 Tax=Populus euphratica TaxID=75702 RepID=A0AAJ6X3S5_POPEU|nr:PREDICTED: UDP-glycosyltransferase 88A1-like [Populus euphratica]